jgi:hypothetical protein
MSTPGGTEMARAPGTPPFFLVKAKTDKQEPFSNSEHERPYLPLRTTVIFGCSSSIPRNRLKRRSVFATLTSRRGCSPSSGGDVDLIPRNMTRKVSELRNQSCGAACLKVAITCSSGGVKLTNDVSVHAMKKRGRERRYTPFILNLKTRLCEGQASRSGPLYPSRPRVFLEVSDKRNCWPLPGIETRCLGSLTRSLYALYSRQHRTS